MTMPPLPAAGDTSWRDDWAQSVHDAATEVVQGRLTDAALMAAYVRRLLTATALPLAAPTAITNPAIISVYGTDPGHPGRIFGSNRSFGPLTQSDDGGTTWANRSIPAGTTGTSVIKMLVFGPHVYALMTDSTSGLPGVYRATNNAASGDWTDWSSALVTLPAGTSGIGTAFNASSTHLFLGDYEGDGADLAALGGPRLQRSADGVTWTTVWGRDANVKHIHAVAEDPYHPGHIYMTVGDTGAPSSVYRSTSGGASGTWTPIISGGSANNWQSVQISFTEEWVWLCSDRKGFAVAVFDRDELVPYSATTNLATLTAVPGAAASTDRFYELGYYGAVDPATNIFYVSQMDTSSGGNRFGVFYLPQVGGRLELLSVVDGNGTGEVFVANGRVYIGNLIFRAV